MIAALVERKVRVISHNGREALVQDAETGRQTVISLATADLSPVRDGISVLSMPSDAAAECGLV